MEWLGCEGQKLTKEAMIQVQFGSAPTTNGAKAPKLAESLQNRNLDGPLDYVDNIQDQPQRKDRPKYQLPWLTQHSNISEVFTRKSSN